MLGEEEEYLPPPSIDDDVISLGTKIEKLIMECERDLGNELFLKLYTYLRENRGSFYPPEFLATDKLMYVGKVLKLIEYEDKLNNSH